MSIADTASWQKPAVLRKALGKWGARDDTRPDPKARAAADDALAAIDATIAELAALRARLLEEMARDAAAHTTVTGEPVEAEITCGADWGSATASQQCMLPDGHDGRHQDSTGHQWDDSEDEQPVGYMECGDSVGFVHVHELHAVGAPAWCWKHGSTRWVTLAAWMDVIMPPASFPAAVHSAAGLVDDRDEDEDAGWTDADLAALPPVWPLSVPSGPWPYARAA